MIRALVTGELWADPQQRTSKNGNPYALARLSVPMGEDGRVSCSVIAFQDDAVARLLQLKAGASVAVAGTLKVGIFTGNDGTARPSLDMVADEVASTTPRPRKPKAPRAAQDGGQAGGDPFGDLPGAGDLDWMGT
ncbi:single-stranded DNA-binding protein [Pseudothauera rhizosphaerae]|uniref:Single-stranded DNA-binding protein n=1 Tax=Pseudothauera rhizosphaerae TaxID=2565932 RepID=A0A4S4AW45_9RHOO|nr:single-stranded DNA-binding protein [Pseudothauera rhizosphaerae]THF64249.1 single-stranded DNA-binding protein [Pseudothauera rhizosphaerae]